MMVDIMLDHHEFYIDLLTQIFVMRRNFERKCAHI